MTVPPNHIESSSRLPSARRISIYDALQSTSYPMASRKQQKKHAAEMKARGESPPKRKQIVEQHFDDCCSDFTPLFLAECIDTERAEEYDVSVASQLFMDAFTTLDWNIGFVAALPHWT